ncbi:MAG TPA: hypothetical protein VGS07_18895 [Thermoanaerobaculia bacterium]|jgi:hypothetical protein|nr:hypothetical protein [Thermoanaerobaculia bacterium]
MEMLSEDDLNLKDMTPEELDLAWDLWFDLAQATNDFDPPYTHGVFILCEPLPPKLPSKLKQS